MSAQDLPERVAVLGAGTMGTAIAGLFARAGCDVAVFARRPESLTRARESIEQHNAGLTQSPGGSLDFTTVLEDAASNVDLVIESIAEVADAKIELLQRIEPIVGEAALLTSNTSSLSLDELSRALARPERFAGLHWFNPPELVALVEIVPSSSTDETTLTTLEAWARCVGKTPVRLTRDIPGFVANRLQYALFREAFSLVEQGVCTYADVDAAVRAGLGARWTAVGPFESLDLGGLDIHLAVARRLFPLLSNGSQPAPAVLELVQHGALGCKAGRGLHGDYDEKRIEELKSRRATVLAVVANAQHDASELTASGI